MLPFVTTVVLLTSPVPSPSPTPALQPLKTIVTVRSTAFCTSLRRSVGPAVAALLAANANFDESEPLFTNLFHDDVIARSKAHADLDVMRLENLIGPTVQDEVDAERLLAEIAADSSKTSADEQKQLNQIRENLSNVLSQQKSALNVLSGFVATEQMGELQTSSTDNASWESVLLANPNPKYGGKPEPPFGSNALLAAGLHNSVAEGRAPSMTVANVGLGFDPFKPFRDALQKSRASQEQYAKRAAQAISDAAAKCNGPVRQR